VHQPFIGFFFRTTTASFRRHGDQYITSSSQGK
jgi:hypothetical protein